MDDRTRLGIVTAAVTAAGPAADYTKTETRTGTEGEAVEVTVQDAGAYQAAVHSHAIAIAVMASETSQIAKSLESISNAKVFAGTVMRVKREHSSTRAIVTLHTDTDRDNTDKGVPVGCEVARTDRTDNIMGLAMARRLQSLVGHRVLVWVEVEEFNGGQGKVRVIKHVESTGADPAFEEKLNSTGLAA